MAVTVITQTLKVGSNMRGFTLLEVLLVMAIIAMAAAIIAPQLTVGGAVRLQAQVREAVAVLNYTRRSAIIEGRPKAALFFSPPQPDATQPPQADAEQAERSSRPGVWVSRGATLQWGGELTEADQLDYQITFYPEGGSSGGELIFTQEDLKASVTVDPITGKITMQFVEEELNE